MKRTLLSLLLSLVTLCVTAQSVTKSIIIDAQSFRPVQTDALTGVNIDPIGQDYSKRDCARLKIKVNRMTKEEIDGIEVKPVTNNAVMKCKTAEYDNGLIVELTAKPQTRFYLHHNQFGDSNEVTLDLEGNKEYRLEVSLNQQYPVTIASNVEGAEVYLNNIYKGTTNSDYVLTVKDVLPGTYALKVVYGGATHEKAIVVSSSSVFFKQEVNIAASQPQFVVFQVTPTTAVVRLDGAILTLSDGMAMKSLKQGTYSYSVDANNYHSEQGTIVVKGEKIVKPVNLRPAFGHLVLSGVADGAAVYVDNQFVGTTPVGNLALASGSHQVQIVRAKYKPYTTTVTISDGKITNITPRFDANFAIVTLVANSGTEILVNNEVKGTGSWSGELEMGAYRIECRKAGHKSAIQSVEVTSSAPQTINLTPPTPIYGRVNIISTPLMAAVAIDGKSVGETPLTLNEILVGKHTLTISKSGYATFQKEITVTEGGTVDINPTLTKQSAQSPQSAAPQNYSTSGSGATLPSSKVYRVGDYYNEGGVEGVVFSVSADGRSGKIVSMKQIEGSYKQLMGWTEDEAEQKKFIGATSKTDGMANMAVVSKIAGWKEKYPPFAWCAALGSAWYLPAIDEAAEFALKPEVHVAVSATLSKHGGDPLLKSDDWYLSSTEENKKDDNGQYCCYYVIMSQNRTRAGYKSYPYRTIRAVAAFGNTFSHSAPTYTPSQSGVTLPSSKVYRVGDYYNEGGVEGVVFSVSADGRSGKIVSRNCSPSELQWAVGSEQQKFIGATDAYDGAKNMAVVQRISGWQQKYPIFAWCASLGSGWYPPAKEEMAEIRSNRAKIESKLSRSLGVYFWTSTESNAGKYSGEYQAWNISHEGNMTDYCKSRTNYTFAVAKFSPNGSNSTAQSNNNYSSAAPQNFSLSPLTFTVNGISFTMIPVEGGTFSMGKKSVTTTVSNYYIGETEVTQQLWKSIMNRNNSFEMGEQIPVHYITWNDCQEFVKKLSQTTGRKFRLPTEAEWEFAARGGNKSRGYKYSGSNTLSEVAVHGKKNATNVKTKQPNELGIYDMSGNVAEFCSDWYIYDHQMPTTPQTNPQGPSSGLGRVWKGGYYYTNSDPGYCEPTYRSWQEIDSRYCFGGLRLVLEAE